MRARVGHPSFPERVARTVMLAIDPNRFGDPNNWADHAEQLFARIEAQQGARLPSARRYTNREQNLTAGVSVSAKVHDNLQALCRPAGAD